MALLAQTWETNDAPVPLHKKLDDLHAVMSDGQTTTTGPMMCETIDSLWSMRTPTLPITDDMPRSWT